MQTRGDWRRKAGSERDFILNFSPPSFSPRGGIVRNVRLKIPGQLNAPNQNVGGPNVLSALPRRRAQPWRSRSRWSIVEPEATNPSFNSSRRNSKKSFLASWKFGEGTPQVTGWFEVMVAGKTVHSKKNGDGFVDDDAKLNKIIKAIKAALA